MGALAMPIAMVGSSLIGGLFGKKAQSSAAQLSPMEQQAATGISGSAGALTGAGQSLMSTGLPMTQAAGNYWTKLLSGNRQMMNTAVAAPRAAIQEQQRGTDLSLERSGVRGAVKDLARSENTRMAQGQIAGLTTGVQPMAAGMAGDLGTRTTAQGTSALGQAGNLWGGLLGQGFQNRTYARQQGAEAGQAAGGLIFDVLKGVNNWWTGRNTGGSTQPAGWSAGMG